MLDLIEFGLDKGDNSLYSSALWDESSVYPKTESGFAIEPYMTVVTVEAFNQPFNQDGNEGAFLKLNLYN